MIGSKILQYQRVESTNTTAEELLQKGTIQDGTVIVAHEQTKGKGQNQNLWISEPGKNLTFSLVLRPHFLPADHQFLLNKAISLGILDLVRSYLSLWPSTSHNPVHPVPDNFFIKWPNDIYFGHKKLGGVLITHRIMGPGIDTSIIGIGLNVNQMEFSPNLTNPTSLKQISGMEGDLARILNGLCQTLNMRYTTLMAGNPDALDQLDRDYEKSLLGFGLSQGFIAGENQFDGTIRGVDELGRLQVELENKMIQLFNHKEVEQTISTITTPQSHPPPTLDP